MTERTFCKTADEIEKRTSEETACRLDQIGREILGICRDELYFSMRFLDVALSSFVYVMDPGVSPFGTDGYHMYFHPRRWGECTGRTVFL